MQLAHQTESRTCKTRSIKKRLLIACLRAPLYLAMKAAELVHRPCAYLWELTLEELPLEAATISEIETQFGISRRQAYKIYRQMHGERKQPLEIYIDGKKAPSPQPVHPNIPFRLRNMRNDAC